ncbi:MAG: Zn-dependent hydrolase [Prevotellaceae bacterium]|jgi:predicted negative regulator of RcsB-dependent stress response|nr:Zn-dependent hydrolase [Prevotellaceae bacterium]
MKTKSWLTVAIIPAMMMSCGGGDTKTTEKEKTMQQKVDEFAVVELKADLSQLSVSDRRMLPFLFETAKIMDELFWKETFGDRAILDSLSDDAMHAFCMINYGPWERLNGNKPFVPGYSSKPLGAQFYPEDMTKKEFEALKDSTKSSLYTVIRRDTAGKLVAIPYNKYFKSEIDRAVNHMNQAVMLCQDKNLKKYLSLRMQALQDDSYLASDMAWMDMRTNQIDFVVGPIESYEDALYGYKAAHEAFILIKDRAWSEQLERFNALLPQLQKALPCEDKYKQEAPGKDSDLGVYDVIYYAGDCNAGSKTIAINLPNDERVHVKKGTRKLQLKNAMKAKFDKIMMPVAELLISPDQLQHVKFDAFFENVMFHEVSHGLGIKKTINGKGNVRSALKETYSGIEEAKADIGGLFMVSQLSKMGELKDHRIMDNYVTFVAGIFRSVRFGASSAHGKANMLIFNYLQEKGAFVRAADGCYKVDQAKMRSAIDALVADIMAVQGTGDYDKAAQWMAEKSVLTPALTEDLARVAKAGIPRDIVFKQGPEVLGLK